MTTPRFHITTWHGEGRSCFYLMDTKTETCLQTFDRRHHAVKTAELLNEFFTAGYLKDLDRAASRGRFASGGTARRGRRSTS